MAMNTPDRFEQRARALHLEASRRLDPATAGRLRAARRAALAAGAARPAHPLLRRTLLPAGAFAVLALAALMIWPSSPSRAPQTAPATAAAAGDTLDSELPPDPDSADPNLYQDLDFYGWLAANGNGGGATAH
jgi:hypothetical protein